MLHLAMSLLLCTLQSSSPVHGCSERNGMCKRQRTWYHPYQLRHRCYSLWQSNMHITAWGFTSHSFASSGYREKEPKQSVAVSQPSNTEHSVTVQEHFITYDFKLNNAPWILTFLTSNCFFCDTLQVWRLILQILLIWLVLRHTGYLLGVSDYSCEQD